MDSSGGVLKASTGPSPRALLESIVNEFLFHRKLVSIFVPGRTLSCLPVPRRKQFLRSQPPSEPQDILCLYLAFPMRKKLEKLPSEPPQQQSKGNHLSLRRGITLGGDLLHVLMRHVHYGALQSRVPLRNLKNKRAETCLNHSRLHTGLLFSQQVLKLGDRPCRMVSATGQLVCLTCCPSQITSDHLTSVFELLAGVAFM
jgi:hypothetical protein